MGLQQVSSLIMLTAYLESCKLTTQATRRNHWDFSCSEILGAKVSGPALGAQEVQNWLSIPLFLSSTSTLCLQMSSSTSKLMMVSSSCTTATGKNTSAPSSWTWTSQMLGLVSDSSLLGHHRTQEVYLTPMFLNSLPDMPKILNSWFSLLMIQKSCSH